MVYSSSGLECQIGMVAVINADGLQTLTAYRAKAKTSFKNSSPDKPFGGELAKGDTKTSGATATIMPVLGLILFTVAMV